MATEIAIKKEIEKLAETGIKADFYHGSNYDGINIVLKDNSNLTFSGKAVADDMICINHFPSHNIHICGDYSVTDEAFRRIINNFLEGVYSKDCLKADSTAL